ncbi:MAG: NrfD/PsrC family molybdoenzyme membrane anchor subunit [Chloroflexota bacterium]
MTGRVSGPEPPQPTASPPPPVIHKPHWKWLIIWYFFLGGIAGGSYAIGSIADIAGGARFRALVRASRYLSLATLLPCPLLLILDLRRPERFLNMLRVIKLRSPMSIGVWTLLGFSGFSAFSATGQMALDGLLGARGGVLARLPLRLIGALGLPFGLLLSGYTGVLLGATAVPLWARNARLLGPLFLTSSVSAASAALSLLLLVTRPKSYAWHSVTQIERFCALAELGLLASMHIRSGDLANPLLRGKLLGAYVGGAVGCGVIIPVSIGRLGSPSHPHPRWAAALGSTLTLVGGFALKFAVVMAGRHSADDPQVALSLAATPPPPSSTAADRNHRHLDLCSAPSIPTSNPAQPR